MRIGTPGFHAARLVEAREARGLTGVALADILGVRPQMISNYETGKNTPSPQVLDELGKKLNFPSDFFLQEPAPEDTAEIFWRADTSATRYAQMRAQRRLGWLKTVLMYLRQYFDFPAVDIPDVNSPIDYRLIDNEFIEQAALACRRRWGLGNGPIPDLTAELEAKGIITAHIHVGVQHLDAFSQWSVLDGTPYIVHGVDKGSAARCRFDAAHELAHLALHRRVQKRDLNKKIDYKLIEDQAHWFAGSFLLPRDSFVRELWAPTLDTFSALKSRWGVSIQAMIYRCKNLGLVTEDQEKRLWINLNRRGWKRSEPMDDRTPLERPRVVRKAIEMLVSEKVRSRQQILTDLRLGASDLEEVCGMDAGFFREGSEITPFPRFSRNSPNSKTGEVVNFDRFRTQRDHEED